ncbi:hypothetical protein [Bacillus sp. Brlt_9]|uniref:hypothetical protein n=1 Tax=Bacillus sp. Brlt_9 TaxID=3110916 RepID=UPI003F7C59BE
MRLAGNGLGKGQDMQWKDKYIQKAKQIASSAYQKNEHKSGIISAKKQAMSNNELFLEDIKDILTSN